MENNIFEGRSLFNLSTDLEYLMQLIRKEVSEEDYHLSLDLIAILKLRTERLENELKKELTR